MLLANTKDEIKDIMSLVGLDAAFGFYTMEEALKKMAGGRKWRTFFKQLQDDARKAAEINQDLRDKLEFKDEQIKRLEEDLGIRGAPPG